MIRFYIRIKEKFIHQNNDPNVESYQFQTYAKEKGVITSVSRTGNCHNNALIESFHSHLKSEGFYAQNIKQLNSSSIIQIVDGVSCLSPPKGTLRSTS